MNFWYSLMESHYRWQYAAAIAFTVGCVGAMMMIAYTWPATIARIWFYAATLAAVYSLVRAFMEWRNPPAAGPVKSGSRSKTGQPNAPG